MSPALPAREASRLDLRMPALGLSGWAGGLLVLTGPRWAAPAVAAALLGAFVLARSGLVGRRRLTRPTATTMAGCLLAATAVAGAAAVQVEEQRSGPVARLAEERAAVVLTARVASDPVTRQGRYGGFVLVRLEVQRVEGRGHRLPARARVLVVGDERWADLALADLVRASGRLGPADDAALAAVLSGTGDPEVVRRAGEVHAGAEAVRAGIRQAVGGPDEARQLVPALVVGDDRGMSPDVVDDFRTCGLTHLAAVSGTNLTLVVGFLLVVARGLGVRARGLVVVGALGVAGFVLLARAEPSVLRAAAMGTVALLGMGSNGRGNGIRALGVAVLALLLADPLLAVSYGFVLSVQATAGILLVAPLFRDRLCRWLPRWAAEAVAIPLAAQLACTPVAAALSGEVSLVAVAANIAVAPAVAPATVLGLLGGLLHLVLPPAAQVVGMVAGACGWWIVEVATQLARLPQAAVSWSSGWAALSLLTVLCLLAVPVLLRVLGHRLGASLAVLALGVVMAVGLPTPGWPPRGWVLVACDVGQGDALVLNTGSGNAVLVDAGPDPEALDRCLDRLEVTRLSTVVLTHFHADHVDGLAGAVQGRAVGELLVSPVREPAEGAAEVDALAAEHGLSLRVPALGEAGGGGGLRWQVVGPQPGRVVSGSESVANNASLVMVVDVRGIRMLAAGDLEPAGQRALAELVPGLRVDVLKVPHHGSRHQEPGWLAGLEARVALISVGAANEYGHPAPETLRLLERAGGRVLRTDEDGDVAVVVDADGTLAVRAR